MAGNTDNPQHSEDYEEFLQLFTSERERIFAYIFSLVPRRVDAEDVFQRSSLILWRKFPDFRRDESFLAWACGVAHFEVRNYLRTSSRDRLMFDDGLVSQLASQRTKSLSRFDERLSALQSCLKKLTEDQRALIDAAYGTKRTVKRMAEATGKAVQTLYNRLGRLRRQLFECVESKLSVQD